MNHSIAAVIFNEDKTSVLCIKRRDVSIWVIPGGVVDEGETLEQSVIREVLEETGLKVSIKRKVGEYVPLRFIKTITHVYECSPLEGKPACTDEVKDIGFYPITKLPQLFFLLHESWIQDALLNHPEVIKRPLKELNIWNVIKYAVQHPIHVFRFFLSKGIGRPINSR